MKSPAKVALITGITGQDGSYLCELLLEKGYAVHGIIRRSSSFNTGRIDHVYVPAPHKGKYPLTLHYGDLTDSSSLNRILRIVRPTEIYNLGAQSHVAVSFSTPEYTGDSTGLGTVRLLEAIHELKLRPKIYQASSSEMYGKTSDAMQNESTPFYPRSPYAAAKVYAYWVTVNFREAYGLFAVNGILFNHESPRRGETFVSRKITRAVGRIYQGLQDRLYLGNLEARRDWGFAKDYVEAMWLMLQQERPEDYVISTGVSHSVRDFVERAFRRAGFHIQWRGAGLEEKGFDRKSGRVLVEIDASYLRPTEVDFLQGDYSKARRNLGWAPRVTFEQLADLMVDSDMELAMREARADGRSAVTPLSASHEFADAE